MLHYLRIGTAVVSFVCGTGAMLLSCGHRLGPVQATQSAGWVGHPNLPDIVVEKSAECVAEYAWQMDSGRVVLESEQRKADEELREWARRGAIEYAAALLTDVADLEIHRALLRKLPAAFAGAGAELAGLGDPGGPVSVAVESAFALTDEETAGLRALVEKSVPVAGLTATSEPLLLAGVRLRAADRLYDFSLRGQLDALAATLKVLP